MDTNDTILGGSGFSSSDAMQDTSVVKAAVGLDETGADKNTLTSKDKFQVFDTARIYLKQLVTQWSSETTSTVSRRKTRKVELNVDALRETGEIKEDETIIPVRIIDTNIKREQPSYINYLRNSRRLAIFTCLSAPGLDTQLLEQEFTKVMTYPEWETPHFKSIDGTQMHGWDSVEVVFDESKPGHVAMEHIGHDKLFFSFDALHLQNCSRLIRAYDLTIQQLDDFVKDFNFDPTQVKVLKTAKEEAGIREETTFRVYKVYHKEDGVVWVEWCSLELGPSDWLKKPEKLYLGRNQKVMVMVDVPTSTPMTTVGEDGQPVITMGMQNVPTPQEQWQPVDENNYPIFVLPYEETEEQKITDHKGRVFLDGGKQEAHTAVLTGFVNGITRASNIYGSPTVDNNDGGPLKLADVKLTNGAFMNRPVDFWHPDYPDPMVLRALQYMDTSNAQEVGDINFAALNRPDSRKTATELSQAQNESQKLDSVQLTLFSTHIRLVYGFAWLIVQSQALQGKLPYFLLVENPDDQSGNTYGQDINTIQQVYDIRAAGDVDVVQKAEMVNKMKSDWPVISMTPLKDIFLIDLLKLEYPNDAARYEKILQQGDIAKQAIAGLGQILQGIVKAHPELLKELTPEQQKQIQQTEQLAQQAMAQP